MNFEVTCGKNFYLCSMQSPISVDQNGYFVKFVLINGMKANYYQTYLDNEDLLLLKNTIDSNRGKIIIDDDRELGSDYRYIMQQVFALSRAGSNIDEFNYCFPATMTQRSISIQNHSCQVDAMLIVVGGGTRIDQLFPQYYTNLLEKNPSKFFEIHVVDPCTPLDILTTYQHRYNNVTVSVYNEMMPQYDTKECKDYHTELTEALSIFLNNGTRIFIGDHRVAYPNYIGNRYHLYQMYLYLRGRNPTFISWYQQCGFSMGVAQFNDLQEFAYFSEMNKIPIH